MKNLIIIPLLLLAFQLAGQRNFTQSAIDMINMDSTAAEGDLYYNTDNGLLYIGLMNGTLYVLLNTDTDTVDYDWLKPDDTHALDINDNIYTLGNVGIGTNTAATARLEVDNGTVRFTDYGEGSILDTAVITASPHPYSKFHLGVDSLGNVVEVNTIRSAKIFYPPSIVIPVEAVSDDLTAPGSEPPIDLYQQYFSRFNVPRLGPMNGPGAIPTYDRSELYYYITDLDENVFSNINLTDDGIFTYDIAMVPPGNCTWINVVFVVK